MAQRVLLAEDEPNIVASLRFLLARAGFEVETCTDGGSALARALETRPDVMVLDLMLPELDGFAVLEGLRANPAGRQIPVVVLTAKGQREDRARALRGDADLFITKPFSNAEIVEAVSSLAGGRPARAASGE